MEEIAFSDWAESMDISGSNHWLPAYGYQQPMQDAETNDGGALLASAQSPFLFLETIIEETSDDLRSESDRSGHAGWLDSDSDTESVIHVTQIENCNDDAHEWSGSERDLAVPKKRRRRTDDEDEDDHEEMNSLSSRSSSLLQFECLEKHCEDVFHTSATSDPFEGSSPKLDSNFSFDSLESNRWRFTGSPDSLDELPEEHSTTTSSDEDASSDDTMLHSSWSSRGSFRSQNSRIRSYRSFDSLNMLQQKQQLSLVELSQSLNNDDFILTQYDAFDKSLVAATADLSKLGGEMDVVTSELAGLIKEDVTVNDEPVVKETKPQRSAENLSEDSGFGDHIPKLSSLQGRIRNATIIEDEDSCSSSYYSSGSSTSGDSEEEGNRVIASSKSLKLNETEFEERRGGGGWDEEESKFNNSCWQSAPNLATLLYSCREGGEDLSVFTVREETAPSVCSGQSPSSASFQNSLPDIIDVICEHDDVMNGKSFEDNTFNMANRLPVVSTPNLYGGTQEFLQSEQQHSLNRVPLKHFSIDEDELDKENTSKSLTPLPSSGVKGVHFCPVVSEVSWRESYSEEEAEDANYENDYEDDVDEGVRDYDEDDDDDDDDEEETDEDDGDEDEDEEEEDDQEIEEVEPVVGKLQIDFPNQERIMLAIQTASDEVPVVVGVSDTNTIESVTELVPPTLGHVREVSNKPNQAAVVNTPAMEAHVKPSESSSEAGAKKNSRFGGFFQRFSFRRRHGVKKEEKKQKVIEPSSKKPKIAKKPQFEDVTVISLHPPPESKPDVVLSSKPPLPPLPPRVVGASIKAPAPAPRRALGVLQPSQGQRPTFTDSSSSMSGSVNGKASSIDPKHPSQHPTGLLETDLDTHITISAQRSPLPSNHVAPKKARSLLNLGMNHGLQLHNGATSHHTGMLKPPSGAGAATGSRPHGHTGSTDSRAKSMEFLLDKENQAAVQPPENELQKGGAGERVMSEHQLRVQRSLQKLNVPDWYKNSTVARGHEGFLLRKDAAAQGRETTHQGWPGLGSKTTSLSSLGSTQSAAARSPTSHLLSPSPTPSPHVFTRWSTSRLNSGGTSTSTSPCNSTRSSFNYRQPYLGWRSQERLSRTPRTPAERLAAGILPAQPTTPIQQQPQVPNLSEVRTSIKEVTSAIVHYVSGVRDGSGDIAHPSNEESSPSNRSPRWERESLSPRDQWNNISRSSSPRGSGRLCWVESSFVGSRPTETPQTPLTLTNDKTLNSATLNGGDLYLELNKTKQPQQYNNHHVNGEYLLT